MRVLKANQGKKADNEEERQVNLDFGLAVERAPREESGALMVAGVWSAGVQGCRGLMRAGQVG